MSVNGKKIVPLGRQASYLEARGFAAERGMRLASHVLLDDYLANGRSNGFIDLKEVYPAWARQMLVHPARDGEFVKGVDVVDSESGWCLPADYLYGLDVFRKGIGLVIEPGLIKENGGRMVVFPDSIVVLHPFIQENKACGKVHKATGVPLALVPKNDMETRWLYRSEGVGVIPLSRDCFGRRYVNGFGPDARLLVAGEM